MKKEVLLRGFYGLAIGIALGHVIAIIISAVKGDGMFYAVSPGLINNWGTELSATIVQTVLCGVLGGVLGAASVIWELDRWSLMKQTVTHFFLFSVTFTMIAYILCWIPRSAAGIVASTAIFIVIYGVSWCCAYFFYKRNVKQINDSLKKN